MGKRGATFIALLVLSSLLVTFLNIGTVRAEPETIVVPDNYSTIQAAINGASEGDTVFVKTGIYIESVTIDKSLALKGENKESTIIDGNNRGPTVLIRQDGVNVTGFKIRNVENPPPFSDSRGRFAGIHLLDVRHCRIYENNVVNCGKGVWLYGSSDNSIFGNSFSGNNYGMLLELSNNNIITGNTASDGWGGIWLEHSKSNTLRNNNMVNNVRNFGVSGAELSEYLNDVDNSNVINGKKVDYLINQQNLIIDPVSFPDLGSLALVNCMGITVQNLDITNNYCSILFAYTPNSTITLNTVANNTRGIWLQFSPDCFVSENNVRENSDCGILLEQSHNTLVTGNSATGNGDGIRLASTNNSTIVENTVAENIESGIAFHSSDNNRINNNTITSGRFGIQLRESPNNKITSNDISLCTSCGIKVDHSNFTKIIGNQVVDIGYHGIHIHHTSNTSIIGNNIDSNEIGINCRGFSTFTGQSNVTGNNIMNSRRYGVEIYASNDNLFCKNNFIGNKKHVEEGWYGHLEWMSVNSWDNGKEGNYWDDYAGEDANGDGIGDTPYILYINNQDRYPLMAPIKIFDAGTWEWTHYNVNVVSNSTVSDFSFNPDEGALIRFNVDSETGTTGFCRVTIPKDLLHAEGSWVVLVDGNSVSPTVKEDADNSYVYFTYQHSRKTVKIVGTNAIPEFPSWIILPLLLIATLFAIVIKKKAFHPTSQQG